MANELAFLYQLTMFFTLSLSMSEVETLYTVKFSLDLFVPKVEFNIVVPCVGTAFNIVKLFEQLVVPSSVPSFGVMQVCQISSLAAIDDSIMLCLAIP